jgi:hypothetical protein
VKDIADRISQSQDLMQPVWLALRFKPIAISVFPGACIAPIGASSDLPQNLREALCA